MNRCMKSGLNALSGWKVLRVQYLDKV